MQGAPSPDSPLSPPHLRRFAFGKNWLRFLSSVTAAHVEASATSLQAMMEVQSLSGKTFLDVGCGSGLSSLAARRLGARVLSFDVDPESVAAAQALRERFAPGDPDWEITVGSVLDRQWLDTLGRWDVVYAWGVLHHTGAMWEALDNVVHLVASDGYLFLALYNDQGYKSRLWALAKRTYVEHPWSRPFLVLFNLVRAWGLTSLIDLISLRPFHSWRTYARERGMSPWWDVIDWIGGWPYEVATPEEVFHFCRRHGYSLQNFQLSQGLGCNQFVFRKT